MPVVELSGCAPPADSRYGHAMDTPTPPITIWHNPACSTSRNALAAIREAGIEPRIVKYLETTPSRGSLETVAAALGGARRLLRAKEPLCRELGLDDPSVDGARLIAFPMIWAALVIYSVTLVRQAGQRRRDRRDLAARRMQ